MRAGRDTVLADNAAHRIFPARPMSDDQLTPLPDSFLALQGPRPPRGDAARAELRARYELCEDLAAHLSGSAQALCHDDGLPEEEVLWRCHAGLSQPASGLSPGEAAWVVRRLAELLRWTCPDLDSSAPDRF